MASVPRLNKTIIPNLVDTGAISRAGVLGQSVSQLGEVGIAFKEAKDATFVTDRGLQYERDVDDFFRDFQDEAADDPDGKREEFDKFTRERFEELSSDGSIAAKAEFGRIRDDVLFKYGNKYEDFAKKQNVSNFMKSREDSSRNLGVLAFRAGQSGEDLQDHLNSADMLAAGGSTFLDSASVEVLRDDDREVVIKNYISGLMEIDPEEAKKRLESGEFDDVLEAKDIKDFTDTAEDLKEKSILEAKKLSAAETVANEADMQEIIMDESISSSEKLLDLNRRDLLGEVSDGYAVDARRYLKSKKEIDAVTNEKIMADIVTQMYDLNTIAEFDSEDYLTGVQNIRRDIMRKRASGDLSPDDEVKLNRQLKTLTSAKTADATNTMSFNFGVANDMIQEQLPPELRGKATRQLFYETEGQDLDEEEYSAKSREIIDKINKKRRDQVLKTSDRLSKTPQITTDDVSDEALLEEAGYTENDVEETAKKYGLTRQQVINRLRAQ